MQPPGPAGTVPTALSPPVYRKELIAFRRKLAGDGPADRDPVRFREKLLRPDPRDVLTESLAAGKRRGRAVRCGAAWRRQTCPRTQLSSARPWRPEILVPTRPGRAVAVGRAFFPKPRKE